MKKIFLFFLFTLILFMTNIYSQENLNVSIGINNESNHNPSTGNNQISFNINPDIKEPKKLSNAVKVFLLITILSLAPSLFILCTSFIRIIIVLAILRQAIGFQHVPPNQVLIGFAIFLTFFNMYPVLNQINKQALQPYYNQKLSWDEMTKKIIIPVKKFMLKQTRDEDIKVFLSLTKNKPKSRKNLSLFIVIPSFVLSEIKTGFIIGFLIYIPFLVVDMIVASILMSMGMMMLPPMMISLPFKILLFVLIDGWKLVIEALLKSFY